jgi:hypothetical protein
MKGYFASIAALFLAVCHGMAASEIVVATRYLQADGTSHSHLFLYREDGTLLRQLTNEKSGQDVDPVFAPDGGTIVFTREKENKAREFWSVEPRGGGLKNLGAAPDWYAEKRSSPHFTYFETQPGKAEDNTPIVGSPGRGKDAPRYRTPDGSLELILRESDAEEDQIDGTGHGQHYLLRDLSSGAETELGKLPGFEGVYELLHLSGSHPAVMFLFDGPLRVAFFGLHLDSTNGDTIFALDLPAKRFVRLSPNWAVPVPLPGEGKFLTLTFERYLPIPDSAKTANCSYVERWDSDFKKVRYAREGSAPICYGFSMYRPGRTPAVITLRNKLSD